VEKLLLNIIKYVKLFSKITKEAVWVCIKKPDCDVTGMKGMGFSLFTYGNDQLIPRYLYEC